MHLSLTYILLHSMFFTHYEQLQKRWKETYSLSCCSKSFNQKKRQKFTLCAIQKMIEKLSSAMLAFRVNRILFFLTNNCLFVLKGTFVCCPNHEPIIAHQLLSRFFQVPEVLILRKLLSHLVLIQVRNTTCSLVIQNAKL